MGTFTFRLPDIGEGIAEAEIVAWHVKVGDRVAEDGRLADMMTDKATVEMESPVSGTVVAVAGDVGDVIAIGSALAVIETDDDDDGDDQADNATSDKEESPVISETATRPAMAANSEAGEPRTPEKPAPASLSPDGPVPSKVLASPAVRQRAHDLGIDLSRVRPAEAGRIRHADLDRFIAYNGASGFAATATVRPDEVIKVIGMRRRIAENMAASKRHIPHFSYVEECDVTALETMRAQLNASRTDGERLTMLPLLIVAICRALPQFPMLNARYDDEAGIVTRHGAVHLGIATQTPAGLMVPLVRNAQALNLWQLAREIARLAEAARAGTARSDELSGSTLTLTSLGPLGGVATTPVINRPEVAIIGPNRIVERPMFVADGMGGERIEKRKLMNISISCDHRVVDGHDAASFVQAVKRLIETPVLLLAD